MAHFKGKQFQKDVIIVAVGYYLRYNLSWLLCQYSEQKSRTNCLMHVKNNERKKL